MTEHGHGNINGPSLIRAPAWVERPLGRYYLCFAHHQGSFIRLAYADAIEGPWKVHAPGSLQLPQTPFSHHIASPDVHVDAANRRLVMVYHGCGAVVPARRVEQPAAIAISHDGLQWTHDRVLPVESYLRVFEFAGVRYGIAKAGRLHRAAAEGDGWSFTDDFAYLEYSGRHWATLVRGQVLHVFYSRFGDEPEHILHGVVPLTDDWRSWRITQRESLLRPEHNWEGAAEPIRVSRAGGVHHAVHELRDPAVFVDEGRTFLIYSIAGEAGLAIAELLEA